jgi:hypothetical protein
LNSCVRLFRNRPVAIPPEARALAGLWGTLVDLALVAALLLTLVDRWAPPQDLPWKPFRLVDPPGLATRMKLARVSRDADLCRQVLAEGGVGFTPVPDRDRGDCVTKDTVRLARGFTPAGPLMTCKLALGYAFWMRHVVEPAARRDLGEPVVRVEHYGTYACRNIAGEPVRSQHAYADAIDVAAFRTASGRRISVARDFRRDDAAGRFLHEVRDGACGAFKVVLSPDYNAAHRDHFHLDHGGFWLCR